MTNIIIIASNSIIYDSRVKKIARSLSKRYSTKILGWNRESVSIDRLNPNDPHIELFNLKTPFNTPSLIFYFPLFWAWVLLMLFKFRPKIIHACDLDTIFPCHAYKLIFRKKVVFDVHDRYAMAFIPPKFRKLCLIVNFIEETLARRSDVLVTIGEKLLGTFKNRPSHYEIIMNCSEDRSFGRDQLSERVHDKDILTLTYTGNITKTRGLKQMLEAIKDLKGVEFVVAGRVIDDELYRELLRESNVKYKGLVPTHHAEDLQSRSDVVVSLYDLRVPGNNFSMGNKLFEAMRYGIPIISNVSTELINETNCGIVVDFDRVDQIRAAIVKLKGNVELRRMLGQNGRKAFLEKYNWTRMEEKLYNIYDSLSTQKKDQ